MVQVKIWVTFFVVGGLLVFLNIQGVANAQWQNSTTGNATNSTSVGNTTTTSSTISTMQDDQVGQIADGFGELGLDC